MADGVHRQRVVAVDQHAGDAVRQALLGQRLGWRSGALRGTLIAHWLFCTNSTAWALKTPGEVQRLEKIALRRRAVADRGHGHVRLVLAGEAHARADRVQRLIADHDLDREHAVWSGSAGQYSPR